MYIVWIKKDGGETPLGCYTELKKAIEYVKYCEGIGVDRASFHIYHYNLTEEIICI